jgi:hypothetical protein
VGFSGHLVFGRSERPLLEAPVFDGMDQQAKDTADTWWPRPSGWQTVAFLHGEWADEQLAELVAWTGAPACCAEVSDSDIALVTGLSPDGRQWEACLNLDKAARLFAEEPADLDDVMLWVDTPEFDEAVSRKRAELDADVPESAEGALVWAAAAGVTTTAATAVEETVATMADKARIERVMRAREVFVEDLFSALLDELGFPEAVEPDTEGRPG